MSNVDFSGGDPNNTGSGAHNPRYDQGFLDEHLESQAIQPMSPYDSVNPNEKWYNSTEPNLPPYDPDSKLEYQPLQRTGSGRQIRVLKVEPGWAYLKLRCSLLHIDIDHDDHVPYEAISYTWGKYYDDPRLDGRSREQLYDRIVCNGTWTSVTRSLSQALQMFRLPDRARILWADALCINQANDEEKSWQVALMGDIYTRAAHVLIWLGYRDPRVVRGTMDLVCQIVNQECTDVERRGVVAKWHDEESVMETPGTPDEVADSPGSIYEDDAPNEPPPRLEITAETLRPLVSLFAARYFSRLWVFQEVALSPGATMFWSNARIRFEWVALVAELISKKYLDEFASFDPLTYDRLVSCGNMYYAWRGNFRNLPFLNLLISTAGLQAFDPRDKIFGLLSIRTSDSNEDTGSFVVADYSRPSAHIFRDVAVKILVANQDLRCLVWVDPTRIVESVPSWVPNFAAPLPTTLLQLNTNAGEKMKPAVRIPTGSHLCLQRGCLSFGGVTVDTITSIIVDDIPFSYPVCTYRMLRRLQELACELLHCSSEADVAVCLTSGFAVNRQSNATDDLDSHLAAMRAFLGWVPEVSTQQPGGEEEIVLSGHSSTPTDIAAFRYLRASALGMVNKVLFRTKAGRLGLAIAAVMRGDIVVVFFGSMVPFVLQEERKADAGVEKHWRLKGASYVCGAMEGEVVAAWKERAGEAEEFHVV